MKRILVVSVAVLIVLLVVYRHRVFLRDPLGKVERGGVRVEGAKVFINYDNDVLIENPGAEQRILVQHGSVPGVPQKLECLRGMVCWTESDIAAVAPFGGAGYRPAMSMTSKQVSFEDEHGVGTQVQLY